jgi:hypothetical protein
MRIFYHAHKMILIMHRSIRKEKQDTGGEVIAALPQDVQEVVIPLGKSPTGEPVGYKQVMRIVISVEVVQ